MLVIGGIIGSGIFLKPGRAAERVDEVGVILGVWVLVGVMTMLGALAVAELAAMHPDAGGPFVYLRRAFGRFVAYLWAWTEFAVVRSGSLGALVTATVLFLSRFLEATGGRGLTRAETGLVALGLIWGLALLNILGTRHTAVFQNLTGFIKLLFLTAIILLPLILFRFDPSKLTPVLPANVASPTLWAGIAAAILAVSWPYHGWIDVSTVSEEVRDPGRNVPRAIILGVGTVTLVYVLANVAYHSVLTVGEIRAAHQASPVRPVAAEFFQTLVGPIGVAIFSAGVMCSTLGAANSNLIVGPRIYFACAREGLAPEWIARIHPNRRTPAAAILLQAGWTTLLGMVAWSIPTMEPKDVFDLMTDFVVFGANLFYALAVGAVFALRRSQPDQPRPYRVPGYPVTPALYLIYFAAFVGAGLYAGPITSLAGLSVVALGALLPPVLTRRPASAGD
jgi:amino acid transporter